MGLRCLSGVPATTQPPTTSPPQDVLCPAGLRWAPTYHGSWYIYSCTLILNLQKYVALQKYIIGECMVAFVSLIYRLLIIHYSW